MRLFLFFKCMVASLCVCLLWFALWPDSTILGLLKAAALGVVASIGVSAVYPEIRGIKTGDTVSVVSDPGIPSLIGRIGRAAQAGKKNEQIKIFLQNGTEVMGVIESYIGLVSPPKIRAVYEERLVE